MKEEPRVPDTLLEAIRRSNSVLIVTHMEPDGDCIASSLALGSALSRVGKEVHHFNPGPFDRSEIKRFESQFLPSIPKHLRKNNGGRLVVVLDCSSAERIDTIAEELSGLPCVVIDHHPSDESFGDIRFVETQSPSTTYLVQRLIEALGISVHSDEADLLMFGLATDTGFFRHLNALHAPVFHGVARLVAAGASPRAAHEVMFGGKTIESRRLIGTLLGRIEEYYDGRLLISYETEEDTNRVGKENRDSDSFYQLVFAVDNCQAMAFVREERPGRCTGSLRSRNSVDVSRVAREYGGGGHKNAAGFLAEVEYRDLIDSLVESFGSAFDS